MVNLTGKKHLVPFQDRVSKRSTGRGACLSSGAAALRRISPEAAAKNFQILASNRHISASLFDFGCFAILTFFAKSLHKDNRGITLAIVIIKIDAAAKTALLTSGYAAQHYHDALRQRLF